MIMEGEGNLSIEKILVVDKYAWKSFLMQNIWYDDPKLYLHKFHWRNPKGLDKK